MSAANIDTLSCKQPAGVVVPVIDPHRCEGKEDCVRVCARKVPARNPAQLGQLQFHWGNPPPAAEPSTRIFKG